ncbi:MAG TPA: glycosyltransferase [Longimicrobiales bacterium]|nr:glycosyltransferase [Longimicrobiales bacterium]
MSKPRISFVVLSYNYARYIGETIGSILAQEGAHNFEIVVVDDASTDDSDDVIRAFSDPRIRYIRHEKNQGHGATVTDGLNATRGELVARIDSDDRYHRSFLNTVVPIFEKYPSVGLVYGNAAMIDGQGTVTAERLDVVHGGKDFRGNEYVPLLKANFICAPTVIARREAWLQALPIPEWLVFHDWFFTLMIARRHDFYFSNDILADYRVHSANYHTHIERNRSEEASVIGFLDLLYGEQEADRALQDAKLSARRRVYASHYRVLASKYFWFGYNGDARRCFLKAIQLQPSYVLDPALVRQLMATVMGRRLYEGAKKVVARS